MATEQKACQQIIFEHVCYLNGRSFRISIVGCKSTLLFSFLFSLNIFRFSLLEGIFSA